MLDEIVREFQGETISQRFLPSTAAMLCLALLLSPIANVRAADLQVLAGGAIAAPFHLFFFNTSFMEAQIEKQLEKILPEDLARTFESAYHVFQGKTEHVDDLLKNGGVLLRKAAQRFTPTQMVLGIAAVAAVAVVLINRASND